MASRNFFCVSKLFTSANLFTIYQVNWQIGLWKWFTIANLFLIWQFLNAKFDCIILLESRVSKSGTFRILGLLKQIRVWNLKTWKMKYQFGLRKIWVQNLFHLMSVLIPESTNSVCFIIIILFMRLKFWICSFFFLYLLAFE